MKSKNQKNRRYGRLCGYCPWRDYDDCNDCGKKSVLAFYACTGQVYEYASQYYDHIIWLAFIESMLYIFYNLVNYDGDEKLILVNDVLMTVSNSVLSLVFGQSQGIAGLAIGTTFSYVLGFVLLIPHFFKKTNSIHFKFYFSWKDLLEAIKLSSSSALTPLFYIVVMVIHCLIKKKPNNFLTCCRNSRKLTDITI